MKAIRVIEAGYPGCESLFMFDNATSHSQYADNPLSVSKINLEDGGKNAKPMRDTFGLMHSPKMVVGTKQWLHQVEFPKFLKLC